MAGIPGQKSTKEVTLAGGYSRNVMGRLDARYRPVKEIKARWNELVSDLGGPKELSYQKQSLVWRFVFLESWIEDQERRMAQGEAVDESKWLASLGTFTSLLSRIGLERKARNISPIERLRAQPTPAPTPGQQAIVPSAQNAAVELRAEETIIEVIP